jgi:branched-chain amino acid transport system permease protein
MRVKIAITAAVVAALALAPLGLGGYETSVLTVILLYVLLAVGLDLVAGYCGQFSFAQGAFYGIGAYTAAILSRDLGTEILFNLPCGILVACLFGLVLGVPALRLKGHFLAIVTIAFQTIVYLAISQWTNFTGGQTGLIVRSDVSLSLFGLSLGKAGDTRSFYWFALAVTLAGVAVAWRLARSRLGREWIAVRDDEQLAGAIGLHATRAKLTAFVASAGLAGAAGVLAAHMLRAVSPEEFTVWTSAVVVTMMVLGGRGTLVGPILGAAVLTIIPEFLGRLAEYKLLLYGVLMIVLITLLPEGIVGRLRRQATSDRGA